MTENIAEEYLQRPGYLCVITEDMLTLAIHGESSQEDSVIALAKHLIEMSQGVGTEFEIRVNYDAFGVERKMLDAIEKIPSVNVEEKSGE